MSSALTILIASSTAVAVVGMAVLLSRLVRTLVGGAYDVAPDFSEFPRLFSRRSIDTGRSIDVKFRQSHREPSESHADEEAQPEAEPEESKDDGAAPYRHVGEEVAAVLAAAEKAAAQIREAAQHDAERIRIEADERAVSTRAELQARCLEVDRYVDETRASADSYAEETRRNAEEQAAKRLLVAEEQARRIEVEAEEMGRELEGEARRQRDILTKSSDGIDARIESVLAVFRGVATELEELLPPDRRLGADRPQPVEEDQLDQALNPASSRG